MAQNIILKRSAVPGRVPDTGSINLGEVAINTFDGKLYFKKSGSVQSVETIVTTNSITSGSIQVSQDITIQQDLYVVRDVITDGDIDASGSLSGSGLSINDTLNITHNNFQLSGSAALTGSLTVLGAINATQFNINIISSSVIFESGSSRFGNTSDDIHSFTGSVQISGSQTIIGGINITGSIIPGVTNTYDLGSDTNQFRHLYISSGSIYMDGTKVFGSETIVPSIGEETEGGIVFYVAPDNSYVLIVDKNDTATMGYNFNPTKVNAASGSAIGTGESNTNAIVAVTGLEQNPARICYDYNGGGYTDWYLPSINELYEAKVALNIIPDGTFYWSSTTGSIPAPPYNNPNNNPYLRLVNRTQINQLLFTGQTVIDGVVYMGTTKVRAIRKSTTRKTTLQTLTNQNISGSISVTGAVTASSFVANNSSKFGNTSDDTHSFTGSVQVTGSVTATSFNGTINATNGVVSGSTQITYASISSIPAGIVSGSTQIANLGYATTGSNVFSGSQTITGSVTATSFVGDGSGLTDLVVDLSTAQLNDVDGNNIPARSFAELYLACAVAEIVDLDFGI